MIYDSLQSIAKRQLSEFYQMIKEKHMLGIDRASQKARKFLCIGAAGFAMLTASTGWSATQAPTLPPDEISPEQAAALSRPQPYIWSPTTNFREDSADPAEQGAKLTQAQQSAGFAWDPQQGQIVLKADSDTQTAVQATDETGNLLAGWMQDGAERRAFFWTPGGAVQLLPRVGDAVPEAAKAVSPQGHVIGQAVLPDTTMGYVWSEGDEARLLAGPEGTATEALGVNGAGDVVGARQPRGAEEGSRAMLWPGDGSAAIDLNSRLSSPLPRGLQLIRADSINEAGEVAAYGLTDTGAVHLVLLTPQKGAEGPAYAPQVLGEVYTDLADQPLSRLEITDNKDISGACSPLAPACFAIGPSRAEELAKLAGVTNVFTPGFGDGAQVLRLPAGFASGLTTGGPPDGGTPGGPSVGGRSAAPGAPFFPSLTSSSSPTTDPAAVSATVAPVPLPAAFWAMLLALTVLLRPWVRLTERRV